MAQKYLNRTVVRTTLVFDQIVTDQDEITTAEKFGRDHLEGIYNSDLKIGDMQRVSSKLLSEVLILE